MELLILLASRHGELVTREEVIERLWGKGVHLDVDQGINTAIRKIRLCLRDTAENPRYVQTIVGKGYRFVPQVSTSQPPIPTVNDGPSADAALPGASETHSSSFFRLGTKKWIAIGTVAVAILSCGLVWHWYTHREPQPTSIRAIAVLPFENLSGDPAQDYFVDGVTDELTTELARMGGVRVISRTSSMQYKHAKGNLRKIARELGVDAVVEGAVSRSDKRVRITAQLIYAASDQHLWANSYERDVSDIFALQSEIAAAVAGELRVELALQLPPTSQKPLNQDAYAEYLRGRFRIRAGTKGTTWLAGGYCGNWVGVWTLGENIRGS